MIFIKISRIVPPRNKISSTAQIVLMIKAVIGPNINPPITMMISFGSYFRNATDGIMGNEIKRFTPIAIAQSIPIVVIFFAVKFQVRSQCIEKEVSSHLPKLLFYIYETHFFHPDFNCCYRNCTGSAISVRGVYRQ